MGFHHIVGVIIVIPVLITGLYLDQNLQLIGIAFLLAGGIGCCVLVLSRTMDRRVPKDAWMDFLTTLGNALVFLVCRFYIFPQQLYLYFEKTNWETNYVLIVGSVSMLMFNLLILIDLSINLCTKMLVAFNNGVKHAYDEKCRCGICQTLKVKSNGKITDFTTQKKTN